MGRDLGVECDRPIQEWEFLLLSEPQTSGSLLLSVAPEAIAEVLESLKREGCHRVTVIGECIPIDNTMSGVEVEMQRC